MRSDRSKKIDQDKLQSLNFRERLREVSKLYPPLHTRSPKKKGRDSIMDMVMMQELLNDFNEGDYGV